MKQALTLISVLILLFSCGKSGEPKSPTVSKVVADTSALRIAVMPTLDCLPLYLAAEQGFFAEQGVSVGLHPFMAQMDCDTAFIGGSANAIATDLVRAERLRRMGKKLVYVATTEASWQLLSSRSARMKQLKQLDDKMVAMTRFSATDFLSDLVVDSARLKTERVFRIQVNDVGVRLNMMQTGNMDAMFLPEPQATEARNLHAHVMLDTRHLGLRMGVLAVSENVMTDEMLKAFGKAYDKACDSLNEHGLQYYRDIIINRCGIREQTVDSLPTDFSFAHLAGPREVEVKRAKGWLDGRGKK